MHRPTHLAVSVCVESAIKKKRKAMYAGESTAGQRRTDGIELSILYMKRIQKYNYYTGQIKDVRDVLSRVPAEPTW